jgi:hypothetical protein
MCREVLHVHGKDEEETTINQRQFVDEVSLPNTNKNKGKQFLFNCLSKSAMENFQLQITLLEGPCPIK